MVIIRPGFFNMIPYFIHQYTGLQNSIREQAFIFLFDTVFCISVWLIVFKLCRKFL